MLLKLKKYIQESIAEAKKVNWLTKSETKKLTIEVILFTFTFVLIYGFFDSVFARLILFLMK
jgi:preprotein translocase SecE subunit